MLRETLLKSLNADDVITVEAGRFEIDIEKFVRKFKENWIYLNDPEHPISYESFSGSLFLLLQKNLGVTNASVHEIVALLKVHSHARSKDASQKVTFFADDEYTKYLSNIVVSAIQSFANLSSAIEVGRKEDFVDTLVSLSGDLLESTIVMNVYFSSILLHVPKSIALDVRRVTAESGYIHSSGSAVYVRNVEKAVIGDLEVRLKSFLAGFSEKQVFITPYADEFFSPYDFSSPVSIRNGLSGVKLQLRKHYIEGTPLLDYLATLPERFEVQVPLGIRDYSAERRDSKEADNPKGPTETKGTIWFVVDYALQSPILDRPNRSEEHLYLFVYSQAFLNDNQLILFKERKPGWYASITLPHTLSISLVNMLRGNVDSRGKLTNRKVFLDPFYGTGTTLFDAVLRMEDTVIIGFDREPLAERVASDNARFFTMPVDELVHVREAVDLAISFLSKQGSFSELKRELRDTKLVRINQNLPAEEHVNLALLAIISNVIEPGDDSTDIQSALQGCLKNGMPGSLSSLLEQAHARVRILVFCIWRSLLLGTFSIRNDKNNLLKVIANEFSKVSREINHIVRALRGERKGACGVFVEREGLYSHSFMIDCERAARLMQPRSITFENMLALGDPAKWDPGIWIVRVDDSITALEAVEKKVDYVLTDPPYGFNSEEETADGQIDFFSKLIPGIVRSLRPQGQACLVLPAFAKNGRQIPFYETHEAVVRQFIVAANRETVSLATPVETFPKPKSLFKKPLYWSSASVLERRIVHFTVS